MHSVVSWGLRGSISFALDLFVTKCFITGSCVQPLSVHQTLKNLYEVTGFTRDETVEQDLRVSSCSTLDLSMLDPLVPNSCARMGYGCVLQPQQELTAVIQVFQSPRVNNR